MDPNANLKEQREIVKELLEQFDGEGEDFAPEGHAVYRLLELQESLDEWCSNGGFLPTDWGFRHMLIERGMKAEDMALVMQLIERLMRHDGAEGVKSED